VLADRPEPGPGRALAVTCYSRRTGIVLTGALCVLLAALCAGCGQKGALYLPDESPEAQAGR